MNSDKYPYVSFANLSDAQAIADIFHQVTQQLLDMGINQWDFSYPLLKHVQQDILEKNCYAYRLEGQVAGVITINDKQDEQYENIHWKHKEGLVYVIHRLAVNPAFQKRRIATTLCKFAEDLAIAKGGEIMRLDAYSKNPYSTGIYKKLGYAEMEEYLYFHGNVVPFYAYEKRLK